MKKKINDDNLKKFSDYSNKSWVIEDKTIKTGDSALKIMSGVVETIEVKDILYGDPWQTFCIVIDQNEKVFLLKTSRELK
jgi:hypothetical protein